MFYFIYELFTLMFNLYFSVNLYLHIEHLLAEGNYIKLNHILNNLLTSVTQVFQYYYNKLYRQSTYFNFTWTILTFMIGCERFMRGWRSY